MSENRKGKVIVIGSGVGGLATAVRMAHRGYEVTVYEKNPYIGGKVSPIEKDGFFWGFGASLFTFPELLDEVFTLCGKDPTAYYKYHRVDPVCHYFYEDGTRIASRAKPEDFAKEVEEKTGEPAAHILKYLKRIEGIYESTKDIFLHKSLHKLKTYLTPQTLRAIANITDIGIHKTLHAVNEQAFKDPRIVQLFDHYATYNGSDPYVAPSTLSVIAHPEYGRGAYILDGGMPDLTRSLHKLALELGVVFHTNVLVDRIEVKDEKATGVLINCILHPADIVVSNMDVVYTYTRLMPDQKAPGRTLKHPMSSSVIVFYWGIRHSFPEIDLHNMFFSKDYAAEFEQMRQGKVPDDPTIYLFNSSKYQPKHAPEGCENWFTLINVPHENGQDWTTLIPEARRNIIAKINRALGIDIEPLIVSETVNYPKNIEEKTLSYLGSIYGASSNDKFSAFLRHPNFSRSIDNLYFCGGSVHPGSGVPLCLLSAKIIDELIP
ncbi:MAG: crtI [Bacteroidetes bacterium]|nr:crtI [Bacteroidota bacterium]